MDGGSIGDMEADTYREEITNKMNQAWELARSNIKKA